MNMADIPISSTQAAHRHSSNNRQEILRSEMCGCFYCLKTFLPSAIEDWIDDDTGTALCPHCGIDSVLGAAAGFPLTGEFLKAMHREWFDK